MKVDGDVILLETFTEVHDVFYAPVEYEREEGSSPGLYASLLYCDSIKYHADDYKVRHAKLTLTQYSGRLKGSVLKRKLSNFDFIRCEESDHSWWGYGANNIGRIHGSQEVKAYLRAAKHIAHLGFNAFEFRIYDDEVRITRSIEVRHKKSNAVINIDDLADPNMYMSMAAWVSEMTQIEMDNGFVNSIDAFIEASR